MEPMENPLHLNFEEPTTIFSKEQLSKMNLQYYNDEIHRACFKLPRFASEKLWKEEQ